MEPVYSPNVLLRGPVILQKLSDTLWLVGENHRLKTTSCPSYVPWLDGWLHYARKHPSQSIHFLTEVTHLDFHDRSSSPTPVRPIDQLCTLWATGGQAANMHLHDADGRFFTPFFPLEMLYHRNYFQHMMEKYASEATKHEPNQGTFLERQIEFSHIFQQFESQLLNAISTTQKAKQFLKSLLLHTPPKWYNEFMEITCKHIRLGTTTPTFLNENTELRKRFIRWLDEHLEEHLLSRKGKYSPFMEGLRKMSPWVATRAPKLTREPASYQYFTLLFSICLEVHMLCAMWTLQQREPKSILVLVTGFQHTRSLLRFLAPEATSQASYATSGSGCIRVTPDVKSGVIAGDKKRI